MVKQCRDKGCGCREGRCKAVVELSAELGRIDAERAKVAAQIRKCQTPRATVRPDWTFPQKPTGDYELVAYLDLDGYMLMWHSDTEHVDTIDVDHESSWPFVEEFAYRDDWERLGIRVEE